LEEVKEGLQKHSLVVAMMLIYYSNICIGKWRSNNMRKMDLDRYRTLIEDIKIVDPKGHTCRSLNELDAVFAVSSEANWLPLSVFKHCSLFQPGVWMVKNIF
jgi:hypothetical protein